MEDFQVLKSYQELFSKYYVENNIIDSEITTEQEVEILKDLEPDEVHDNLKDLLHTLLEFKRIVKSSDKGDFINTIKEYEQITNSLKDDLLYYEKENEKLKMELNQCQNKIDILEASNSYLTLQAIEKEKELRENKSKNENISEINTRTQNRPKSNAPEKIQEISKIPEKPPLQYSKTIETPHKRTSSYSNLLLSEKKKQNKQTIKSVKFEYYVGNTKCVSKIITDTQKSLDNNISRKIKPNHYSKSNSNISTSLRSK